MVSIAFSKTERIKESGKKIHFNVIFYLLQWNYNGFQIN